MEHMRSTDGTAAWSAAHEMVQRFSTNVEYEELVEEFGWLSSLRQRASEADARI